MAIDFACAECGRKLRVADAHAGRRVTCPKCGSRVRVAAARHVLAAAGNEPPGAPHSDRFDSSFDAALIAPLAADDRVPTVDVAAPPTLFAEVEHACVDPLNGDHAEVWYLRVAESDFGPLSREELDAWVDQGRVDRSCQVCNGDMAWRVASEVYPDLAPETLAASLQAEPQATLTDESPRVPVGPDAPEPLAATIFGATLEQLDPSNDSAAAPPHSPNRIPTTSASEGAARQSQAQARASTDFSWGGETHWRQPVTTSTPRLAEVPRSIPAAPAFLQGLCDSSFQRRVTPQVVRVVYGATLATAALMAAASLVMAVVITVLVVQSGQGQAQLFLLIPGLISIAAGLLISVLVVRLLCEAALHLLRIAEACDRPRR